MGLKRDILIGLGILGVILLIASAIIGIVFLFAKAFALLVILAGVFLVFFFSDAPEAQSEDMGVMGAVIGIILLIIGAAMLLLF